MYGLWSIDYALVIIITIIVYSNNYSGLWQSNQQQTKLNEIVQSSLFVYGV